MKESVADVMINKQRPRVPVAKMVVGDFTADFNPSTDPTVAPLLWEIRRERMVELMGE